MNKQEVETAPNISTLTSMLGAMNAKPQNAKG
jgi:hypothetical protein